MWLCKSIVGGFGHALKLLNQFGCKFETLPQH